MVVGIGVGRCLCLCVCVCIQHIRDSTTCNTALAFTTNTAVALVEVDSYSKFSKF